MDLVTTGVGGMSAGVGDLVVVQSAVWYRACKQIQHSLSDVITHLLCTSMPLVLVWDR